VRGHAGHDPLDLTRGRHLQPVGPEVVERLGAHPIVQECDRLLDLCHRYSLSGFDFDRFRVE